MMSDIIMIKLYYMNYGLTGLCRTGDSLDFIILSGIRRCLNTCAGERVVAGRTGDQRTIDPEIRIFAVTAEYFVGIPYLIIPFFEKREKRKGIEKES